VVVDMVMPVMDGLQTLRELRKLDPQVRVLVASGFAQNERIDQMLEEGAQDFIHKPYNLHEIVTKLQKILR
jgi:two-component system, cell cycle sensor histidine kinase and response regulator CckA